MTPKQPPSVLNTISNSLNEEAFVSYADKNNTAAAFSAYGKALDKIEPITRSVGSLSNQFKGIDRNASVRGGFSRLDYEFFRPAESVPRMQKQIISACMSAYDKIGIVRNIIDTMADFAIQGIRFSHPNKQIENFYNEWFKRVNGLDRSERFLNLFYRAGNVLVKRSRGKLKEKQVQEFKRAVGQEHLDYEDDFDDVKYREIPLRYTFLNPMSVDAIGQELTAFTGKYYYVINVNPRLINIVNNPKDEYELGMVNSLPTDIVSKIKQGSKKIPISDDDLIVYHYKKDDWQVWANPMTYAILDDLITLEKMKLADLAALDGAISHIRIWKLGSLEHQILPTDAAVAKLADLLLNNVGGGSMDLIWGPDLELDETSTEIQKFLGSPKYEVCLASIYAGLGVPPSMTGTSSSSGGGFNQNFISLKTLTERLKYGRNNLKQFWDYEAKMVQLAMKFKQPPTIIFDIPNLGDEMAEKALWIQAVDRELVSDEAFQERWGVDPDVERRRLDKQYTRREKKQMPPKVSPYHDAQPDLSLEKIFAQRGGVTPSEVGLTLEERQPGEKTALEVQQEQQQMQLEIKKKQGVSGEGRPKTSKDSKQRKRRATKASEEFVNLTMWAQEAQKAIAEVVTPFYLDKFNKPDLRQLTADEQGELENMKFALLLSSSAYSDVDEEYIYSLVQNPLSVYKDTDEIVDKFVDEIKARRGESPTLDEMRKIHCFVYAMYKGEFDGNSDDND